MSGILDVEPDLGPATAGEIAVINLESARENAWSRFWRAPQQPGVAEYIVEQEGLALGFLGDLGALDRLETLVQQLAHAEGETMRTAVIQTQVASMAHRFAEARDHLTQAQLRGAPVATVKRLTLGIDQACGTRLPEVLAARRQIAAETRQLEDLVPLGALLADLWEFDEADQVYCSALREYQDVSPFALAWVCFQLGVLWGELVPEQQSGRAARWYEKAVAYLPAYVKARVHLAEIYLSRGRAAEAEALLIPALSSGDPEVSWRLGDALLASGKAAEAAEQIDAARIGFERLLEQHLLAFADHGAEFYSGSGNNADRAYELASVNVSNRPTLRAFEQAHSTALGAANLRAALEIRGAAARHWGAIAAFQQSLLAAHSDGAGT
jgi:tetratricopeptide (TPR) repeat protein